MRRLSIYSILAILALSGCQTKELNISPKRESKPFTATIEDGFNGAETKTYLDEHGNVLWKQGDQISIFVGSTINEQYQVTDDSEGKTAASLNRVTTPGFVAGGEIDNNIAFYPYTSTAAIARNESAYVISDITLPAVQNYTEASFGNGAFPMAAETSNTEDMHLKFKNVLGGLKLQLKGTASIASISITGNQNEVLCGAAAVTVSNGSAPSINLTDATAKTVTLNCGVGVQLNAETATAFVIALPPMTMEGGFTVVVTDTEGKQMEIKTTKTQTINRSKLLKMPAVNYVGTAVIDYAAEPFTVTSAGNSSVVISSSLSSVPLKYKKSGGNWTNYTMGSVIDLADGESLQFIRDGNGESSSSPYQFVVDGPGNVTVSGNIHSLLSANYEQYNSIGSFAFNGFFYECTNLVDAANLILPATTLEMSAYENMFLNCTNLIAAPDLPAISLGSYCYRQMFQGCTSLTTAPRELPATVLPRSCYENMFYGCSSLVTAPEISATSLENGCCIAMFYGCSSLVTAPSILPAMTLANYCYQDMFHGCTSLTTAPELPAITLKSRCYNSMFQGCSSLTTAPVLPATWLVEECYQYMFSGCTNLNYVKALFKTTPSNYYTGSWLANVSEVGTFVKNKDATWDMTGADGIPSGWTVLTE